MLRICYRHCCRVNCAVNEEKYSIVKRKAYINSKASVLGSVIVNSTVCICWGYAIDIVVESIVQWLWKNITLWKGSICKKHIQYTGLCNCKQYCMYMLRICYRHFCRVNCAVIVEKYHIVKRTAYVNSKVSVLGSVIVNSTVCICWVYDVNIVLEWIGQWLWKNITLWKGSICKKHIQYTGLCNCKQYCMYMLRICYRHFCRVNCAVIVKKYHIVKRTAYVFSKVSILDSVIVNSSLCICWGYTIDIVVEWIVR